MVAVDPRNLPSKFGQNRIWNNCDIDGIEFPVVDGGGWVGSGGEWCEVMFVSSPIFVMLG